MSNFGYARVSSLSQDHATQIERLKAAGCDPIRAEKVSGKSRDGRTELDTLLQFIRAGDSLTVVKLDRLGRNTRDVLNLAHELETKGAHLRILDPAISTDGPMGKVMLTVLAMVAEMERGFIRERQHDGIAKAKRDGKYLGRPVKLDHDSVRQLHKEGIGATAISRKLKCSRAAVYKVLAS